MVFKDPCFISPETKEKTGGGAARANPLLFDLERCQLTAENKNNAHPGRSPSVLPCMLPTNTPVSQVGNTWLEA